MAWVKLPKTKAIKVPCIYCRIYERLKESSHCREVEPSEIQAVIRTTVRIPKQYGRIMLQEMEEFQLIKKINHQKYLILTPVIKGYKPEKDWWT